MRRFSHLPIPTAKIPRRSTPQSSKLVFRWLIIWLGQSLPQLLEIGPAVFIQLPLGVGQHFCVALRVYYFEMVDMGIVIQVFVQGRFRLFDVSWVGRWSSYYERAESGDADAYARCYVGVLGGTDFERHVGDRNVFDGRR